MSVTALLRNRPGVRVEYTRDQEILKGRRARYFPSERLIAIHADLRRLKWRCSLAHELAHDVLGHTSTCDPSDPFFDQAAEVEADLWAARVVLLPDLEDFARQIALTCNHGHAASALYVTLDMFEARLRGLDLREHHYVDQVVRAYQEGVGA